jgi:nucleoside 2-deoxyribosyltransferase
MIVVYTAGPYRAGNSWAIEQNIRDAELASLQVWRLGAVPICPHTMTRHFQGALPDATWLTGDLELVRRSDAVVMIGDWQHSQGACAEKAYAEARDVPVFESMELLATWLQWRSTKKVGDPLREQYGLPLMGTALAR